MPEQRLNEADRAPVTSRLPHYPTPHTRDTVVHLVAFGCDKNQISYILKCLPSEVEQHYAEEIEHGTTKINARVQSALLHKALYDMDVQAQKLWLINKAGWKAGDGNKVGIGFGFNGSPTGDGGEGTFTVTERRVRIETVLRAASSLKRQQAAIPQVIDGEAHEVKANGHAKPNGNGHAAPTNGTGAHASNGATKPRGPRTPPATPSVLKRPGQPTNGANGGKRPESVFRSARDPKAAGGEAGKTRIAEDRLGDDVGPSEDEAASGHKPSGANGSKHR